MFSKIGRVQSRASVPDRNSRILKRQAASEVCAQ